MAIVKMDKFTLLTFHTHKQRLLKELQVFGDVHFRGLGQQELSEMDFLRPDFTPEQIVRYEQELEKVKYAAARLAPFAAKGKLTDKRQTLGFEEFDRYGQEYDYDSVYRKVKEQDDNIASIRNEISRRKGENETLSMWRNLDAAPEELDKLDFVRYQLGTVNRQGVDEFSSKLESSFEQVYIEQLDIVKDDVALLLLYPVDQEEDVFATAREAGFTKAAFQFGGMPSQVIESNLQQITQLQEQQQKAEDAIRELAGEHPKLEIALDYFNTVLEREKACQNFLQSDTVVLLEGWVPTEDKPRLEEILKNVCGQEYCLETQAVEKDSGDVPIKLKNNSFVTAFESITAMYSMPRYNEIDPTPLLTPFYWVFFGMMVGDIGYGLVMLVGITLAFKLLDLKGGMAGFLKMFQYLSVSVILFGFVYGGAFGKTVVAPIRYVTEMGEIAYKPILDSQLDIVPMLIISIVIGVFQILFGLAIKAYMGFRDGDPLGGFADGILFIITVVSGIGWILALAGMVDSPVFKWVFLASLVGLAATQGRESPSIGGKIGNGLYSVYGLTSYVGDIVSYTRIVALALSGAYIAYAFNLMTGMIVGDFSGNILVSLVRLLCGIVVVVFGQALNFGLALLGAYVHTCRLQYVEYFGKFYEGGGRVFRPLTLKNEYIHIKK